MTKSTFSNMINPKAIKALMRPLAVKGTKKSPWSMLKKGS